MKLTLARDHLNASETLGSLLIDGEFDSWTLEDTVREVPGKPVLDWKIRGCTAIPTGHYRVIIDFSQRFQKMMPHVLDVPGFEGIRIHPGNSAVNTEGCILVARYRGPHSIWNSKIAYDALFAKIETRIDLGVDVTLDVVNPGEVAA
jgi:hypothetical protein